MSNKLLKREYLIGNKFRGQLIKHFNVVRFFRYHTDLHKLVKTAMTPVFAKITLGIKILPQCNQFLGRKSFHYLSNTSAGSRMRASPDRRDVVRSGLIRSPNEWIILLPAFFANKS